MAISQKTTAVGIFVERTMAESALNKLRRAGFSNNQLSFIARHHAVVERASAMQEDATNSIVGAATGGVGGGVIGGVAGALSLLLLPGFGAAIPLAVLAGGAIGAVAGGFAGSLMRLGVPEAEAHYYQDQLASGRSVVLVHTPDRYDEALSILRQAGADDATVREDQPRVIPTHAKDAAQIPPSVLSPGGLDTEVVDGLINPVNPTLNVFPVDAMRPDGESMPDQDRHVREDKTEDVTRPFAMPADGSLEEHASVSNDTTDKEQMLTSSGVNDAPTVKNPALKPPYTTND